MSAPDWTPAVGGGATVCHYSDRTTNGEPVIPGRRQFHDYNF